MRFCRSLMIVAAVALAMVGANVAKADGAVDPKVKLIIPNDPIIEPCSQVEEQQPGVTCFTSNSFSNPVDVAGPTMQQLNGTYDLVTNFIYEPTDCTNGVCPPADTLMDLWIAVIPTINNAIYTCGFGTPPNDQTPAFNTCPVAAGQSDGVQELEMECDPTPTSPCTGLLPGEEGSAEVSPEPGEFAMLGLGIALVGLAGWKRRQTVELSRANQENLAAC